MVRNKGIWITGGLLLTIVLWFASELPVLVLLDSGPLWIYFVLTGIITSGYLAFSQMLRDREIDRQFIEKEGQIYMERIEQNRGQ